MTPAWTSKQQRGRRASKTLRHQGCGTKDGDTTTPLNTKTPTEIGASHQDRQKRSYRSLSTARSVTVIVSLPVVFPCLKVLPDDFPWANRSTSYPSSSEGNTFTLALYKHAFRSHHIPHVTCLALLSIWWRRHAKSAWNKQREPPRRSHPRRPQTLK